MCNYCFITLQPDGCYLPGGELWRPLLSVLDHDGWDGSAPERPHICTRASPPLYLPQRGGKVITLSWPTAARGNCSHQKMTCPGTPALLITFLELKVTPATAALKMEGRRRKVNQSSISFWRRWWQRLMDRPTPTFLCQFVSSFLSFDC